MEGHRAARDGRSGLLWRALPVCALLALGVLLTCGASPCWPAWLASSPGRPAAGQPCCTRLAGGPRPRQAPLRPAAGPAVGLNPWGRLRLGFSSCRDAAVHAPPRQPFFLPNTSRSFPVIRTPTCPAEWSNAYFLHIPKTAGSFVDNVMRVGLGSCGSSRGVGNWCHRFTLPQLVRPSNAQRLAPCGRAAGRAGPAHERLLCVFAARALWRCTPFLAALRGSGSSAATPAAHAPLQVYEGCFPAEVEGRAHLAAQAIRAVYPSACNYMGSHQVGAGGLLCVL